MIIYIINVFISLIPNNIPSHYQLCNYLLLSNHMGPRRLMLITTLLCLLYKYLYIHFAGENIESQKLQNLLKAE